MLKRLLIFLFKYVGYFFSRWAYRPVSLLWRFLFERKYKEMPRDLPWTTGKVLVFFAGCKWVSDKLGGIVDVISKPEKFFATRSGDCDDHSIFACHVLNAPSTLMSVNWYDNTKKGLRKFRGHNVCLFKKDGKFYHISNWGLMGSYATAEDAARSIANGGILCLCTQRDSALRWLETRIF